MSAQPPDFNRLLAEGREHDFSFVRAGCVATVRTVPGDHLRLPSGRLIAAEPPANFPDGAGAYAFTQTVEPGDYPVELVLAESADPKFSEVAAARVVIRAEPVQTWRPAVCPGQDEDEVWAYPVDGGTGSFGSVEVFDTLGSDSDARDDLITDASFDSDEPYQTYWDDDGNNVVMFHSGGGDGRYATWVGYTASGETACFLTDFRTLTS